MRDESLFFIFFKKKIIWIVYFLQGTKSHNLVSRAGGNKIHWNETKKDGFKWFKDDNFVSFLCCFCFFFSSIYRLHVYNVYFAQLLRSMSISTKKYFHLFDCFVFSFILPSNSQKIHSASFRMDKSSEYNFFDVYMRFLFTWFSSLHLFFVGFFFFFIHFGSEKPIMFAKMKMKMYECRSVVVHCLFIFFFFFLLCKKRARVLLSFDSFQMASTIDWRLPRFFPFIPIKLIWTVLP